MNDIVAMLALFIAPWQGQHFMALAKPLTVAEALRRLDALAADIESLRRLDNPKALQAAVALVPVALLNVAGAPVPTLAPSRRRCAPSSPISICRTGHGPST